MKCSLKKEENRRAAPQGFQMEGGSTLSNELSVHWSIRCDNMETAVGGRSGRKERGNRDHLVEELAPKGNRKSDYLDWLLG